MIFNNAKNTISNNQISQDEIETFNKQFTAYSGSNKTSSEVKALYSMVISNNSIEKTNNSNRLVKINNEIPTSTANNLGKNKSYTIIVEYDSNGYINNIIIK